MQDRMVVPAHLRDGRVDVQRVVVAREPVQRLRLADVLMTCCSRSASGGRARASISAECDTPALVRPVAPTAKEVACSR